MFMPITPAEAASRGIERPDFIIVTGDAYVDHPSFGVSIIGRLLTGCGYRVGLVAQPDWRDPEALKVMGRPLHRVKNVALLGGSRISMYLTWELARTNTHVRIVEQDHDKCLFLSQHLPGTMIIEGDGTDNDLIQAENIFGADGFVSLTGRDEENLLMAMSARRAGVRKVLAKMTRPNYIELVQDTGLGSIISPKDIIANQITRYVRALANSEGMAVESLYKLLGGQVEALEFLARGTSNRLLHVPLKDLQLRSGVLLAAIVRGGVTMIPGGMTTIEEGDHVLVIARSMGLNDLTDILA